MTDLCLTRTLDIRALDPPLWCFDFNGNETGCGMAFVPDEDGRRKPCFWGGNGCTGLSITDTPVGRPLCQTPVRLHHFQENLTLLI